MNGRKDDNGKPQWHLLPLKPIIEVIKVLTFGATKYEEDNWKRVDNRRVRYYNAAMRHLTAWFDGEKNDPETGLHHLAHATCCLLFLLWDDNNGPEQP